MKILLVNPPPWYFAVPYSGYAILYDILKSKGYEVKILELTGWRDLRRDLFDIRRANYMDTPELYEQHIVPIITEPVKKLSRVLADENWDVIGFTLNYLNIFNTKMICREIKKIKPGQIIIGGGYSCFSVEAALNISNDIDYYFIGDADDSLPLFLDAIKNKKNPDCISGVLNYKNTGAFKHAVPPDPSLIEVPSYDGFNENSYSKKRPRIAIMGSRGCPWAKCRFCISPQMHFRKRNRNHVISELRYHLKRGMKDIIFNDPSFPSDEDDLKIIDEFYKVRKEFGYDYGIEGQCRISNLLTPEIAAKLKDSGFGLMMFGYESGSDRLLEIMNKGITRSEILNCVKNCKKGGLNVSGYFLIGHPKETEEDFFKTASLVIEMSPYLAQLEDVNTYMFQLGTDEYKDALNNPEISMSSIPFGGCVNIHGWHTKDNNIKTRQDRTRFIEILTRVLGKLPDWRKYNPGSNTKKIIYSDTITEAERYFGKLASSFIHFMNKNGDEKTILDIIRFLYNIYSKILI